MNESSLERVVTLANLLLERKQRIDEKEAELAELKSDALRLEREELPLLMSELELTEVKLANGRTVSIKEDCDTKITEANKPRALAWLLDNGYGGIIKTLVAVEFGKGEHEAAENITAQLRSEITDREIRLDETVHPSTLKAFVKERMAAGDALPLDLFGVYSYSKAVIK